LTPRYRAIRPRASVFCEDDIRIDPHPGMSVNVHETEPVYTGLLDADGNELVRMPEPIGFIHFED
jgi:hypothetical protein